MESSPSRTQESTGDDILTLKSEFIPQTRSFSLRVGAQPKPSIEFCRNSERHTSPSSDIFGCHSFVVHLTFGG